VKLNQTPTIIHLPNGALDSLLVCLVVLDGWLSGVAISLGAFETNMNPIVAWSISNLWSRIIVATVIVLLLKKFGMSRLIRILCHIWLVICLWSTVVIWLLIQ
jgi:hypothetical protein